MKTNKKITLFFFLFLISPLLIQFCEDIISPPNNLKYKKSSPLEVSSIIPTLAEQIDFNDLSEQINDTYFENIKSHINNFTQFSSRYTGYPGYEKAVNYIQDFFNSQNLEDVSIQTYPLQIPLETNTSVKIGSNNYRAFSLLPNSIQSCQTPKEGISGNLVYGGFGYYTEFDNKEIEGSIVILEFNSQDNWINAASLGAKGVIYLAPNNTNRFEANQKVIDIPLNFPRVYVNQSTDTLRDWAKQNNQTATIFNDMTYTSIEAKNIEGTYPSDVSDDIVVISAYFDSSSIVPSISPGADEASGIATLLELIRLMNDNDIVPQKTIKFLALSGHNQASAGAREFVYQNYDSLNRDSGIKLFFSLDLSTTNNLIGLNPYGYLYRFKLQYTSGNNLYNRLKDVANDFLLSYASDIQTVTDDSFDVKSFVNLQTFEDIAPITFYGDQEPFVASNVLGLSFFTAESYRLLYNTPFDLPQNLELNYLKPQVIYTICSLVQLLNEETLKNSLDLSHRGFSLRHNTHVGFANIQGYVKEYNESSAWLSNVPNALVRVRSFDYRSETYGAYSIIAKADDEGFYEIHGVSSSQPDYPLDFRVEAYLLNSEGKIVKAINLGTHGQIFKNSGKLSSKTVTINPTIFDCGTIAFFQVTHPYTQAPVAEIIEYKILDPQTRAPLFSYGFIGEKTISLVFLTPDTPAVMVGLLPDGVVAIYATNSSDLIPKGSGFQLSEGEFRNLGIVAFITVNDFLSITQTYIDLYTQYNIYDALVDETYQKASKLVITAQLLRSNHEYSQSLVTIKQVQTSAYDAFSRARGVITDGTSSTIFFAIILLPFSFALTALLFNFDSGMKKIISTCIIYGSFLGFFYIVHPGLHLSSNISMIIIGVIATIFVFPALYMIYSEGYDFLKGLRVKMIGTHFADTSRTSSILVAMTTGIARMKKRKGRTLIALSGIILITLSLTLFTSASTQVSVFSKGSKAPTPYNGVLFRTKDWNAPLSEEMLENLGIQFGNDTIISSHWWLYPFGTGQNGYVNVLNTNTNIGWEGSAILGVTIEEIQFHPIESTLALGSWFNDPQGMDCILPQNAATDMGININDTVIWAGSEFTVIGIVDNDLFDDLKDFDNEGITPKNNHATSPNVHIGADQVLILPSETAKTFGASLFTISILANQETSEAIAESISTTYGRFVEVRVGFNEEVAIYKRSLKSIGRGFVEIGLPLAIAILLMVNTSISTVYESKKEINTFTSLGLAPFHIAGLFLAEFLVYAVLGSVIGYLAGITIAVTMSMLGLFPESLAINYSSGSVVNALGFGMVGILLATIYPLNISAKMSVPSVKRTWELATTPDEEGKWTIHLPFVATTEQEAVGIIEFLREFIAIYESDSVGGLFFAQNIRIMISDKERKSEKRLSAIINLAPFDMGIKQKMDFITYLDEIKYRFVFQIDLVRLEGIMTAWEHSVRRFIDVLRKQMLIWRNIPKETKLAKAKAFEEELQKVRK
ncbi:MAG: M28 family peptidase [Candidatus Hodarchaeales archaeon]|jgi:hypothetical protein